jgi:hypothetical protein
MIDIDYHSVDHPSHWHMKHLIAWLEEQTGVPSETKYRLFKYVQKPDGYTKVERLCTHSYLDLPEYKIKEVGLYEHIRYTGGPGWQYEERFEITIDWHARSTSMYYSYFHFTDENLAVFFKLIMHEWQEDHLEEWQ